MCVMKQMRGRERDNKRVHLWGCRRHPHPASAGRMAKNVGIKLYVWNCKKVIFSNNGADQYPGQNEEGLSVSGEKWYKSGNFYNQNPDLRIRISAVNY